MYFQSRKFAFIFFALCLFNFAAIHSSNSKAKTSQSGETPKQQLENVLIEMGYEDILIDGCWLEFSRNIVATKTDGYTHRYTRFFNLDSFDDFSQSEIEKVELRDQNSTLYVMWVGYDPDYTDAFVNRIIEFKWRINERYPDAGWPFHLNFVDDPNVIQKIESSLADEFYDFNEINRTLSFTRSGISTVLSEKFVMADDSIEDMNKFMQLISAYALQNNCDIEN